VSIAEQRRASRRRAEPGALYRYDQTGSWRACRMVDVAFDAAAIELYESDVEDPEPGRFYLLVHSRSGPAAGATVRALLRRHIRRENGQLYAMIEFRALQPSQRVQLRSLVSPRF
jgi:hypothetical protein